MIRSIGLGISSNDMSQSAIKSIVKEIFNESHDDATLVNRLLPVFDNANIDRGQLAVLSDWFKQNHSFQ